MRTAARSGGVGERVATVTAPFSGVITAAGLQAAGSLPGAFFGTTFALLNPPFPRDLLHTMPSLCRNDHSRDKHRALC